MCADEAGLECVGRRCALEVLFGDCGQPEAVLVSEVVAGPTASVTLDERRRTEVLQTATRRHQRLTAAFVPSRRVLCREGETERSVLAATCQKHPGTLAECVNHLCCPSPGIK